MTETGPTVASLPPDRHVLDGPKAGKLRSAGRPVTNVDVRIVDDRDIELPVGEAGEILVRGPTVTKGYWNQPALTEEALRGGWLHTGDTDRLDDDGFLTIVDRKKDMVIRGGENVFLAEVEDVIHRHPAVGECAVIGVPHEKWGEAVPPSSSPRPATHSTRTTSSRTAVASSPPTSVPVAPTSAPIRSRKAAPARSIRPSCASRIRDMRKTPRVRVDKSERGEAR